LGWLYYLLPANAGSPGQRHTAFGDTKTVAESAASRGCRVQDFAATLLDCSGRQRLTRSL